MLIPGKGKVVLRTRLAISALIGTCMRTAPCSGLAIKRHIEVEARVVDVDYRGDLGAAPINHADNEVRVP